jgi:hypothetical protein
MFKKSNTRNGISNLWSITIAYIQYLQQMLGLEVTLSCSIWQEFISGWNVIDKEIECIYLIG